MKIVFFSTYPPAPCGIGEYTRQLRQAVERQTTDTLIEVVAERYGNAAQELDPNVERAWQRNSIWNHEAAAAVIAHHPDLVHVQHEESMLHQDGRLIRFLMALGDAGIARVVTLHSVYGGRIGLNLWWPPSKFHRAIAANAEAIVVHQQLGGRDTLERQGIAPHKIHVIPHGTSLLVCASRAEARARLNIPVDAKVALFFGVIHRKKNLHTALAAAGRVAKRLPEFRFVIAGRPRERNPVDTLYFKQLARSMRPGIAAGWLDFRNEFVPNQAIVDYLAAADLVLFPHDQSYGSASGVFHLALSAGRAVVCSTSPKFGEAREIFGGHIPVAFAQTRDVRAWARAIETMLSRPELRRKAEELAKDAAASTAWDALATTYLQLYCQIKEQVEKRREFGTDTFHRAILGLVTLSAG